MQKAFKESYRRIVLMLIVALCGTMVVAYSSRAQSDGSNYYVSNTHPPDAFLSLRTMPSASSGERIMAMVNGTVLEVLKRRSDGWWNVRVKATGEEGWALSGKGNQAWIVCCTTAGEVSEQTRTVAQQVYTPGIGSRERTAIMDAARLAQQTTVKFKVNYLTVLTNGQDGIAVADLQDAAGQMPVGGLLFFEATNGKWRALYLLDMDGSENCKETITISDEIRQIAVKWNAPQSFFPQKFYDLSNSAVSRYVENGDQSDCATTARY